MRESGAECRSRTAGPQTGPECAGSPSRRRSRSLRRAAGKALTYLFLIGFSAVFILPFLWMVSSSFKDLATIFEYPPSLLPMETQVVVRDGKRLRKAEYRPANGPSQSALILDRREGEYLIELQGPEGTPLQAWVNRDDVELLRRIRLRTENYPEAWTAIPFTRFLANTLFVTGAAILGQVLSASLVAFAFSRLVWPGRRLLFLVMLATMMLPYEVMLIPHYIIYRQLGWIDTFLPLIVPSFLGGGAFFIFLFRQFFLTLPREMDEAARVDGASSFGIYWRVLMPLCRPIIATTAVLSFVNHWNDFLNPLIYLNNSDNFTLAVGLRFFQGAYETDLHLLMAASTLVLIPVVLVFLMGQKYFVRSIVLSGTKG